MEQKMMKKEKGITLIALVVTIVVLLILAGITIFYVMGDNSIFNKASDAKVQTEVAKVEERAQMIYSDKLMESASTNLNTKVETSQVIEKLRTEGYIIKQRAVSEDDITGISLDKESMTIGKNKTAELKVIYEGAEDPFIYYAEVQGKYYRMHSNKGFITIDREPSNLTESDFVTGGEGGTISPAITITSEPTGIVTASLKTGSNSIIEIKSTEIEGTTEVTVSYGSLEPKKCTVTVRDPILATALTLNETSYTVTGGKSWTNDLQLIATIEPDNADNKEVTWKSSDTSIATVDRNGLVKAGTKGGDVTITATTKDGSNISKECKITTEIFSEIKTSKTTYTDSEGNTAIIPQTFAVGTSDNVNKVTGGLVIQDNEGNQFVWIPVGDFKDKNGQVDHITLGRYTFASDGTPTLKQNADNYSAVVAVDGDDGKYYQELTYNSGNTSAKELGDFVDKTKANGGYYLARYEASYKDDTHCYSKVSTGTPRTSSSTPLTGGMLWNYITQPEAATVAQEMYSSTNFESDLVNSYAWDTAIVFIQTYSGDTDYSKEVGPTFSSSLVNTGTTEDKRCNIYDMASNTAEWTTEFSTGPIGTTAGPCVHRGGVYVNTFHYTAVRPSNLTTYSDVALSFRPLLYTK